MMKWLNEELIFIKYFIFIFANGNDINIVLLICQVHEKATKIINIIAIVSKQYDSITY